MDKRLLIGIGMEPVNRMKTWHFVPDEKPIVGAREVLRDALFLVMVAAAAAMATLLIWG